MCSNLIVMTTRNRVYGYSCTHVAYYGLLLFAYLWIRNATLCGVAVFIQPSPVCIVFIADFFVCCVSYDIYFVLYFV